jgi:dihydrofolate synthase/folylpolyglutamate synthase
VTAFSSFEDAQSYLLGTIDETVSRRTSYKLDRMRAFLRELGDPHRRYPSIHVGGTSGKGSTCTMIAAVLHAGGIRTGLHTKPHLHSMTERARVDGASVSRERFTELLGEMMPAADRITPEFGRPTYYETLLALAFVHFARERVDAAVIEVGLGGRLDGTNVLQPDVTAVTSIGYDHTDVLGDTLEAIAREKAGIARRGVPFVVGSAPPPALETLETCAREAGAPLVRVTDAVGITPAPARPPFAQAFAARTASAHYNVALPVHGLFQVANAATAIAVLERIRPALRPDGRSVERGLARVAIPGRMEFVPGSQACVLDIAHNEEKAQSLVASLRDEFPGRRLHYVVAVSESKDARQIVATLASLPASFTFTAFDAAGRHAADPQKLVSVAASLGIEAQAYADPREALAAARRQTGPGEPIVVTGSTFVVAQLRELLLGGISDAIESSA